MEAIASRLTEIDNYFIHVDNRSGRMPKNFVALLPSFDELLIGYKARHHTIAQEHCHHAFNIFGTFRPVVLNGQQITGTWNRKNLATNFFGDPVDDKALEKAKARYKDFLI